GRVFGHPIDAHRREGKIPVLLIRSSVYLEGKVSASAHADVGAFKKAQGRIKTDGKVVGKIGRGLYWKAVRHGMGPVLCFDDLDVGFDPVRQPSFSIDHLGQFAYAQAVYDRDRV